MHKLLVISKLCLGRFGMYESSTLKGRAINWRTT
ncbi:hypothetical protein LINPERHAP2_LOCUS24124 [Linum perenne]